MRSCSLSQAGQEEEKAKIPAVRRNKEKVTEQMTMDLCRHAHAGIMLLITSLEMVCKIILFLVALIPKWNKVVMVVLKYSYFFPMIYLYTIFRIFSPLRQYFFENGDALNKRFFDYRV